jgi:hypothetical protein
MYARSLPLLRRLQRSWRAALAVCLWALIGSAWAGVVIIAHPGLRKVDAVTVQRIYSGKVIDVVRVPVQPVNLPAGAAVRQRFLAEYLQLNDEGYKAYWTVRRYVGKGTPPRELGSAADVISYVQTTAGAIGYVDEADNPPTALVLMRR